jgi:type III secretion system YscQ/HrcQ family protein
VVVRAWSTDDLGKVSGPIQATFEAAVRRLGFEGRAAAISVPALGEVTVSCRGIAFPARPGPGDALWSLRGHGAESPGRTGTPSDRGFLIVDALSCLSLVSATLGLPAPRVHRAPTRIERGIVAATLGALLRTADPSLTLALESTEWVADGQLIELELLLACVAFRQSVRLQVPPAWIPACTLDALAARLVTDRLPVRLPLELARTSLPLGDWWHATLGDAVVFDGFAAVPAGGGWPVTLRCGRHAAAARWDDEGLLRVTSDFQPTDVWAMPGSGSATRPGSSPLRTPDALPLAPNPERRTPIMADDEKIARLSMLAAAPIEIVAEVGQLHLRADELIALQRGSVISLRRPRTTLVDLRMGERVWARGELVDVDGELGVRLTELVEPDPPPAPAPVPTPPAHPGPDPTE